MFHDKPEKLFSKPQNRLYLRHGPIDLHATIELTDCHQEISAYRVMADAFDEILPTLCTELNHLRKPIGASSRRPAGAVAQHMFDAAKHFSADRFVTPMIAVAGSVSDYLADLVAERFPAKRIYVNNGGDITLRLFGEQEFTAGICSNTVSGEVTSYVSVSAGDDVGGIATSGWRGRSHSLGIADAVTVLARNAAFADAAATLIANNVNISNSGKVKRQAACELSPDSDLGERLVTTNVAKLTHSEKREALAPGVKFARELTRTGLIHSAYLAVQGEVELVHPSINFGSASYKALSKCQFQPTGLAYA